MVQVIQGYLFVGELVALRPKLTGGKTLAAQTGVQTGVAITGPSSLTGPPLGSWRNSSSSSCSAAFSAGGFVFMFLARPTSIETPRCCKALAFLSETNPGAG